MMERAIELAQELENVLDCIGMTDSGMEFVDDLLNRLSNNDYIGMEMLDEYQAEEDEEFEDEFNEEFDEEFDEEE